MEHKPLSAYIDESLKKEIARQLQTPSVFVKLLERETARKELILRQSLEPWRLWLVDRIKWRRLRKWFLRDFLIVERPNANGDKYLLTVWKGSRILKEEDVPIQEIRFVRRTFAGGDL